MNTNLDVDLNSAHIFQGRPGIEWGLNREKAIEVEMVEQSFSQLVILRANTKVSIQKTTQTDLPISEALTVT